MRWPAVLLLAAAAPPATLFSVAAKHRLVEGIASDGRTVWVSSVIDRTIVAHRADGDRVIRLPKGVANPLGLAWDARRHWLWMATDCPELPGIDRCESGALVAIDTRGKLRATVRPAAALHSGDVSVGGGDVFVSDSRNGAVYRLRPGGRSLETLVPPGIGRSAQGSALDPAGKRLIVADYAQGLFAVDLDSRRRTPLLEDGRPLRALDGLIRVGDQYFAAYNGARPGKVIRFRLRGDAVADATVIDASLPEPTQLAGYRGWLLVVADAGWEEAAKPDAGKRTAAPIVSLPL